MTLLMVKPFRGNDIGPRVVRGPMRRGCVQFNTKQQQQNPRNILALGGLMPTCADPVRDPSDGRVPHR